MSSESHQFLNRLFKKYDPQFCAHFAHSISYLIENDADPFTILTKDLFLYSDPTQHMIFYLDGDQLKRLLGMQAKKYQDDKQGVRVKLPVIFAEEQGTLMRRRYNKLHKMHKRQTHRQQSSFQDLLQSQKTEKDKTKSITVDLLTGNIEEMSLSSMMSSSKQSSKYDSEWHQIYDVGGREQESFIMGINGEFQLKKGVESSEIQQMDFGVGDVNHLVMEFYGDGVPSTPPSLAPYLQPSYYQHFPLSSVLPWSNQFLPLPVSSSPTKRKRGMLQQVQTAVKQQKQLYGVDGSGGVLQSTMSKKRGRVMDKAQSMLRRWEIGVKLLSPS